MNRHLLAAIGIILLTALCIWPTLAWQEFSNTAENLVIATAQEMRRGGPWLAPTLHGELRWQKPPVTSWITATAIFPSTMRDISSPDLATRRSAFDDLARETRGAVLLAGCAMLLGIFALGSVMGGGRIGLVATMVAASSFFFLRFSRYVTTDLYLALFVTWTNVLIVRAILHKTTWANCIGAGVLLGIAIMTKGPVALVQTAVPVLIFALWRACMRKRESDQSPRATSQRGPLIAAVIATIIVGLPWWLYVMLTLPDAAMRLQKEMTGIGMPDFPDPWYSYFFIVAYVMPWIAFFIVGLIQFVNRLVRRQHGADVLAGMLLIVPMVIMAFFRERHDRYLLPILGPAAIVIAFTLQEHLEHWRTWNAGDRLVIALHWLMIVLAIVLFLVGASKGTTEWMTRQDDGLPWFTQRQAAIMMIAGLSLMVFGAVAYLRRRGALITITFLIALAAQVVVMRGFVTSETARSDMRDLADKLLSHYPDAVAYNAHPLGKRAPSDLGVYLNRQLIWIADPSTLGASDRPLVLFMLQNKGEPAPAAPPGWLHFDQAKKKHDTWHAFVLPEPNTH